MNTNSHGILILSLTAGVLIGVVFFGGLWLTVAYGLRSKHPALLFSLSFFGRTAFVLTGFYIAGGNQLDQLIACLLGFLGGRFVINRFSTAQTKLRKGKVTNAFDP